MKSMINRIITRHLLLNQKTVYFFSKDPFQKFNKKKLDKNVSNTESIQKNQPKTNQKSAQSTIKNMKADMKGRKMEPIIGTQRERLQNIKKNSEKPQQNLQENKIQEKDEEMQNKKHDLFGRAQKQTNNPVQKTTSTDGFSKFKKNKNTPKQKDSQPSFQKFSKDKDTVKEQQEKDKKDEKQLNKKQPKAEINQINIDLSKLSEQQSITVLRKPRTSKRKPNLQQSIDHLNNQKPNDQPKDQIEPKIQQQKQQSEVKKAEQLAKMQDDKQQEYWRQFEHLIKENKSVNKFNLPRYERLNLYQDPAQKQKKQKKFQPQKPADFKSLFIKLIGAGVGLLLLSSNNYFSSSKGSERDPQYLKEALQQDRIEQTWVQNVQFQNHNDESTRGHNFNKYIYIRQKSGSISYCISNKEFERVWKGLVQEHNSLVQKKSSGLFIPEGVNANQKIVISKNIEFKNQSLVSDMRSILSLILFYYFIKSMMDMSRGRGGKGKGATNLFEKEKSYRFSQVIKITFKDVVGMQKSKQEIVQFIDFLKHPEKYNKLGARIPKGALLTGPPGTGKTMIAKACAGQSKVPFYTISGSQFIEMYVGVGAQRVRALFKQAKENAPSIIFIDQIDAVGKKRSGMGGGGGNDERDTTLNQLLVQMDGFDATTNVIIFAATNQKEVLDPALTRPGRFDRLIQIDLPDLQGRREIFQVHLKPLILDRNVEIKQYAKRLATLTPGFSGADIKNVCNEAAIIAARNNKQFVSIIDFQLATQRIIGGVQKKSQLITPQTRKIVAYHECGHGVVSWFIQNANPLLKLTIIPRSKGALGFAQYLPNQHQMYTRIKLLDQICVILGGRISQQIFFGKISTGASDDLNKAYQIAKTFVTQYGFGQKLGWIQYNETQYAKEYSKQIENRIDSEILNIMKECSQRTHSLILQKKQLIHNLAERLLEKETIDQNVISEILGERPFKMSKQHEQYIREKKRIITETTQIQKDAQSENKVLSKRADYLV